MGNHIAHRPPLTPTRFLPRRKVDRLQRVGQRQALLGHRVPSLIAHTSLLPSSVGSDQRLQVSICPSPPAIKLPSMRRRRYGWRRSTLNASDSDDVQPGITDGS